MGQWEERYGMAQADLSKGKLGLCFLEPDQGVDHCGLAEVGPHGPLVLNAH